MTTINCSADCVYQKDGKCSFDKTIITKFTSNGDCAYFKPKIK